MFSKTMIALCSVLVLATTYGTAAQAQQRKQGVQPYTGFEKMWFAMPKGEEG